MKGLSYATFAYSLIDLPMLTLRVHVFLGPPESQLKLSWSPRVIRPGVQLTLDVGLNFRQYTLH